MRLATERALSAQTYERLTEELRVYDVDQGGWEHENEGLVFNSMHVLKELVRARRKDVLDPLIVEGDLAPDSVQYALRFGRWADIDIGQMLPTTDTDMEADSHSGLNKYHKTRLGGWALAEIKLADFTHMLDHASERDKAISTAPNSLAKVSRFLLYFAESSADEFDFDLADAFRNRLTGLRERFEIPEPDSSADE